MEWRNIETAPRDGTLVDLWCCSGGDERFGARYADCKFEHGHWRWLYHADGWVKVDYVPTHWMPTPPAPTTGDDQ